MGAFVAGAVGLGGRGDELFVGRGFLHLVDDAGFGGHDEGIAGTALAVVEEGGGGADVAGVAQDRGFTFGVGDDFGFGVLDLQLYQLFLGEGFVNHATALPKQHVSSGLGHDIAA